MATLYVGGGSDATSKASNAIGSPWASLHRAMYGATFGGGTNSGEAAAAGDTVIIDPSFVYEAIADEASFYIALNPFNQGTVGNPIRFQAPSNARDLIRIVPRSGSGTGGSIIGSADREYIELSGFDLNETDWPWNGAFDTQNGKAGFFGVTTGCLIEKSKFTGNNVADRSGDNYVEIRTNNANDITIRNCDFLNHGLNIPEEDGGCDESNACITSYATMRMVIENNRMLGTQCGIYLKGNPSELTTNHGHIVRKNWINAYNTGFGIIAFENAVGTSGLPISIYKNVIKASARQLSITDIGFSSAVHIHWINNTLINSTNGAPFFINGNSPDNAGLVWKNNIIYSPADSAIYYPFGSADGYETDRNLWDRNMYHNVPGHFVVWAANINFATWQGLGQDVNSVQDDPEFVDPGEDDYRLQVGSPARTLGRVVDNIGGTTGDVCRIGAYMDDDDIIGLTDEDEEPPASAPRILFVRA